MSWQPYVDNLLASGHVAKALICGLDGTIGANSTGFAPSVAELKKVIQVLTTGDQSSLYSLGIVLEGVKFTFLRAEPNRSLYGRRGTGGVVVVKAAQNLLISIYEAPMVAASAIKTTETLADYLISKDYY